MIIKESNHLESMDKFEQAGHNAESQLAFYLKREFKDDPQILVFNNLRLEKAGDACQIDHLILHKYGIIIIESKSVTTRVEVNELGEWKRWFNNAWQGMPSPILQAQRQGKLLKEYFEDHVEELLNKTLLGDQLHFTKMPIDVLVAISDSGIINRPQNDKLANVCKADQIADKVNAIIKEYQTKYSEGSGVFGFLSLSDPIYKFGKDTMPKISEFLLAHHKPIVAKKKVIPVPSPNIKKSEPIHKPVIKTVKTISENICSHCQSKNLSILYGHSYYFRCHDCNKNTAIKNLCPQCGSLEKTRKSGLQFFTECQKCGTSRLLHTNSSTITN